MNFLSLDYTSRRYIREPIKRPGFDDVELPFYGANFFLTPNKVIQSRQAYTFMGLLGDFGGFNDALLLILGLVGSLYSSRMYLASVAAELPFHYGDVQQNKWSKKTENLEARL